MKLIAVLLLFFTFSVRAQYTTLQAHSHNDYEQKVPFVWAYNAHFGSIEADIWAVDGQLLVAHTKEEISRERSLVALYIQPIVAKFRENNGTAWSDRKGSFQLLIDLKTSYQTTLKPLASLLSSYPEVFDPKVNPQAVRVIITGNTPPPLLFDDYPDFIFFDGKLNYRYTESQRKRLALFSDDLARYTSWKGKGNIPESEAKRLTQIVDSIHALSCKIRFWDAPDVPSAWQTLMNLKVDYINTDHIQQLEKFLEKK